MSEGKRDRATAPRDGSRPSRAKQVRDRNITPPSVVRPRSGKPKKGARVMEAQLAERAPEPPAEVVKTETAVAVDVAPPADPWWTTEREDCYRNVLSGIPQHQVAAHLGRDRHTIARWCDDERFMNRLAEENESRFRSMRQRRVMQTVQLTDKAYGLATRMLEATENDPSDMSKRFAARDWLSEFREQSRREDEIYGLDKQRVDVNVHGSVQHQHKGSVNLSFKEFVTGAMKKLGVDVDHEEVDAGRADDALVAITERALLEGTFLDELVERENEEKLVKLVPTTGARQ